MLKVESPQQIEGFGLLRVVKGMLGLGGVCFFNILVSQPNHQNRLLTKSVLPSSVTQAVKRAKSPLLRYSNWLLLTGAAQH